MTERGLALVVVTHNARAQLETLLDGIADDPGCLVGELVVVDNDSRDGTAEMVAARSARVRYLRNSPGRGFAAAVNQGVRETTAPDIAIVTVSTRLTIAALDGLQRALHHEKDIAAVGPLIRSLDGTVQKHGLFAPRPLTAAVVLLGLGRFEVFRREADRYYGPHRPGPPLEVDNLSGACVMVRRAAWAAVGEFDERFFLYCEDVDWSLRARQAGWRLLFVPEVEVRREKSASSKGNSVFTIRLYYRSLRAFYRKHHAGAPLPARTLWLGAAYLREAVELVADRLRREKGLRY